jgi:hypothetical protein
MYIGYFTSIDFVNSIDALWKNQMRTQWSSVILFKENPMKHKSPKTYVWNDHTTNLLFHRCFHRELLDMPEYRTCVEEELTRTFGVQLFVATAAHPDSRRLHRNGLFGNRPA